MRCQFHDGDWRCTEDAVQSFEVKPPCACGGPTANEIPSCFEHLEALGIMRLLELSFACPHCGSHPHVLGEAKVVR